MDDPTQASGAPPTPAPPPDGAGASVAADRVFEAVDIQRGLLVWLGIIAAGGVASTLLGHVEGAVLFAGAGAFALAQASDAAATIERYRAFVEQELPRGSLHGRLVRGLLRSLIPLLGAGFYVTFGMYAWKGMDEPQMFAAWWCAGAVVICLLLAWRPFADAVMRVLFRGTPGRTRRLTARLVVIALLLPVPARALVPTLLESLLQSGTPLADASSLLAQLMGELAIALAGVGLFVRRDWRGVRQRLGLTALKPSYLLVIVAGVLGTLLLNSGTEWIERTYFPALWQQDSDVTRMIAGHLSLGTALLLGVSAGVGEEVAMRGALQPRLGVTLSALVFASGHVQYTWFGMLTVGLLGLLLGIIRKHTNTTTVIAIHVLYDIYAAVTAGG